MGIGSLPINFLKKFNLFSIFSKKSVIKNSVISIIAFLKDPKSLNLSFNASKLSLTYKKAATSPPNATINNPVLLKSKANFDTNNPPIDISGPIAATISVIFIAAVLNSGDKFLKNPNKF